MAAATINSSIIIRIHTNNICTKPISQSHSKCFSSSSSASFNNNNNNCYYKYSPQHQHKQQQQQQQRMRRMVRRSLGSSSGVESTEDDQYHLHQDGPFSETQEEIDDNNNNNLITVFGNNNNNNNNNHHHHNHETAAGALGGGGLLSFEGGFSSNHSSGLEKEKEEEEEEEEDKWIDRGINATIVLAAGTFAISKLLTIDHDYWHGWTLLEILRYAPQHNWTAYEQALKTNPVFAKMLISGVVYSLGDWIAQCCEGKPLFDFDRSRMFRSGLVGFTLHGSLSHYYYHFCEALFPFQDWWVLPAKVAFDQTVWAALWNSIYYVFLGFLRLESPVSIFGELKTSFWPMLTAGWKLWPFAHLVTYGMIPVEQRLLWVDCVELIWVTILSTISNEKSEARISEAPAEANSNVPRLLDSPED